MKTFRNTMTINAFIKANSQEEADEIFQNMHINFSDDGGQEIESDLIDWEINEIDD